MRKFIAVFVSVLCGFTILAASQNPQQEVAIKPMNKVLVVYYSRTGNTKKVALDLAAKMNADIEEVVDKADRSGMLGYMKGGRDAAKEISAEIETPKAGPENYELIVIGTPVWAWNMSPAARAYILKFKNDFKNTAFFTTSGGTKPDKIVKKMEDLAAKSAVGFVGFTAGELSDKNVAEYEKKLNEFIKNISSVIP